MLRWVITLSFLLLACDPPATTSSVMSSRAAPACVSIGAWNDLHGQLEPAEPVVDSGNVPAGGVLALADSISDLRNSGDAVVLLDAGDLFTGPLGTTIFEGAPVIDAYNVIGVDAVAVGNHDFDFGPVGYAELAAAPGVDDRAGARGPRGALMARMASAKFPFLSANIHLRDGTRPPWPNFAASIHVKRKGFDVGVVGYTTIETPTTTSRPNVADLEFVKGAGAAVAREVRALRASGADPVVLLAHASLDGHLSQILDDPADVSGKSCRGELAALVAELGPDRPDVILAGHRHAWMLGRIDGIPVVSNDQRGVGFARVRFCRDDGRTKLESIHRNAVLAATPPRTELGRSVAAAVAPWERAVKEKGAVPIATIPTRCAPQSPVGTGTAEQIARAMRDYVIDQKVVPGGARVVAITNSGAVRTALDPGVVTFAELFGAFPFETTVAVCKTTEDDFAHLLRNALADPSAGAKFPFALAGAKAYVKRSLDNEVSLDRVAIEGTGTLYLALPDFVLDGGDAMLKGVTCEPITRMSARLRDLWGARLARDSGGCELPPKNVVIGSP